MDNVSDMDKPGKDRKSSFLDELKDYWQRLPNKGIFFGLLSAWILLFQFLGNSTFGYVDTPSLFYWMYDAYNAPLSDDDHGNLIPFVVLILFWWKRRELFGEELKVWWPALAGLVFAELLHLLGYVVQQPRISIVGFFVGVYSIMGIAWGPGWLKRSFFPFILFAFCIPISSISEVITFPLRMLVTKISVAISNGFLGIQVIRDGSRIFDPEMTFRYDVAPACSGIRSLISLVALTTIYGFITFRKSWKRVLVIALSVPLAVAGNVMRITGIIVGAEAFGQKAGMFVHEWFGFITFALAIIVLLFLGQWLREPEHRESKGAL
ncbi:MAG: exosortase/archaeosortase family protein [Verrucomicrobia bacterium]|nr:exosortase/archaeosortase family protein [Verrucomicrobiota bacterium]